MIQNCQVMCYSRDSFYRFRVLHEEGGDPALAEITRPGPDLKNQVARLCTRRTPLMAVDILDNRAILFFDA